MEYEELIKKYIQIHGKEPSDDIKDFIKSGEEKPLIYKDGKIIIPKAEDDHGSQSNR